MATAVDKNKTSFLSKLFNDKSMNPLNLRAHYLHFINRNVFRNDLLESLLSKLGRDLKLKNLPLLLYSEELLHIVSNMYI